MTLEEINSKKKNDLSMPFCTSCELSTDDPGNHLSGETERKIDSIFKNLPYYKKQTPFPHTVTFAIVCYVFKTNTKNNPAQTHRRASVRAIAADG